MKKEKLRQKTAQVAECGLGWSSGWLKGLCSSHCPKMNYSMHSSGKMYELCTKASCSEFLEKHF
jgi:hypothetical protein